MPPVRLKPVTFRSRVKYSTTEPLRSLFPLNIDKAVTHIHTHTHTHTQIERERERETDRQTDRQTDSYLTV